MDCLTLLRLSDNIHTSSCPVGLPVACNTRCKTSCIKQMPMDFLSHLPWQPLAHCPIITVYFRQWVASRPGQPTRQLPSTVPDIIPLEFCLLPLISLYHKQDCRRSRATHNSGLIYKSAASATCTWLISFDNVKRTCAYAVKINAFAGAIWKRKLENCQTVFFLKMSLCEK